MPAGWWLRRLRSNFHSGQIHSLPTDVDLKRRFSLTAKYIVGIDLGTTNSALACCDATASEEESQHRSPQHSAACESERSGGTYVAAIVSLHPGRIRFSQRQPGLAMGTRTEARDRRTGAQTRRGESQPPRRLRQILALLRCGGPHCADLALASARGGAQAIAGRSVITVLAVLAHCVGQRRGRGATGNSLLRNRTCCSLCPLRSTKKHAS